MTLRFGSLFSGFGGLDLGLERAGLKCMWQCENNTFARRVLAKHWPDVHCADDVRGIPSADTPPVDLIAGGFPCQDISTVGKRGGIHGEQSGLWFEFLRIVRDLRPKYVVVENVADLFVRGFDIVLGGLAEVGFDAEWHLLQASDFGLPHRRRRLFIIAHPHITQKRIERERRLPKSEIADWKGLVLDRRDGKPNGVPGRMERIRGLGNAVCPVIAEWIGKRIIEIEEST